MRFSMTGRNVIFSLSLLLLPGTEKDKELTHRIQKGTGISTAHFQEAMQVPCQGLTEYQTATREEKTLHLGPQRHPLPPREAASPVLSLLVWCMDKICRCRQRRQEGDRI